MSMKQQGVPIDKIAADLQRTVNSITARIRRGVKISRSYKKWSQTELDTLFELHQRGVPIPEIARKLHRDPESLKSRLQLPCLVFPKSKPWTKESFDELMSM